MSRIADIARVAKSLGIPEADFHKAILDGASKLTASLATQKHLSSELRNELAQISAALENLHKKVEFSVVEQGESK